MQLQLWCTVLQSEKFLISPRFVTVFLLFRWYIFLAAVLYVMTALVFGAINSYTLNCPSYPKSQILFHKKNQPQDFIRKTLALVSSVCWLNPQGSTHPKLLISAACPAYSKRLLWSPFISQIIKPFHNKIWALSPSLAEHFPRTLSIPFYGYDHVALSSAMLS